jgi:two-component system response regulator CpxR
MESVLIIDDDVELCGMLRQYLAGHGMRLESRDNGCAGLEQALTDEHDLVLLDLTLPGMEGLKVLQSLRRQGSDIKVMLLTALDTDADRIMGLEYGADDYLAKPFNVRELLARMRAILRRGPHLSPQTAPEGGKRGRLMAGGFTIDFAAHTAWYKNRKLELTDIEFSLLGELLQSPGTVLGREELVARVLGRPFHPLDRSLDMHVSRLRRKLETLQELQSCIKTIRSAGYLLTLADPQLRMRPS